MSGGQMRCPIVFRGPNGAASRVGAQHSQNYGPWYASVPGLVVIAPYDSADAKGLLKAAIRSDDPVVFLENELLYGHSFDVPLVDDYVLPIGKARIMREGNDVTLVSYSIGVGISLEAAEKLAAEGISAEVIDLRTLRPLDKQTVLTSLSKTNRLVVVEEGWPTCSISSEIMSPAVFLLLVEVRLVIGHSPAIASSLPDRAGRVGFHIAILGVLPLIETLGAEVDLIFVAFIAEKECLAAVSDEDEGVVGKRHQGLLFR